MLDQDLLLQRFSFNFTGSRMLIVAWFVGSRWSDNILVSKLKACSSDELDPEIQIMSSTSRQRFDLSRAALRFYPTAWWLCAFVVLQIGILAAETRSSLWLMMPLGCERIETK